MNGLIAPCVDKHFTASGLVLVPDYRLLLVRHRKLGVWIYPGGHIRSVETPDDALRREVYEETRVSIRFLRETAVDLSHAEDDVTELARPYAVLCERINSEVGHHYHVDLIYLCGVAQGSSMSDLSPNKEEIDDAGFFSAEDALGLHTFANFRKLLFRIFKDKNAWATLMAS